MFRAARTFSKRALLGCVASGGVYLAVSEDARDSAKLTAGGIARASRSLVVGGLIMWEYKSAMRGLESGSPEYSAALRGAHERAAIRLRDLCASNGGLYIKVGQTFASMEHVLPKEFTSTLMSLQDQAPYRAFSEVEKIFEKDLGKKPSEIFEKFDHQPIAAASIAQVHFAQLKSGERVAVKVQYPELRERFDGDFRTLQFLCDTVSFFFPAFAFGWTLPTVRSALEEELSFVKEAENAEKARKNLRVGGRPYDDKNPLNNAVHVPKVYHDIKSERILVTEFIDGFRITDVEAIKKHGLSLKAITEPFLESLSEQIFVHGFIHADPHPGNILVRPVRKGNKTVPQIVLLDHGLYRKLEEKDRLAYCRLWQSMVMRNDDGLFEASKSLGVKDAKLFAIILLMRSYDQADIGLGSSMTRKEAKALADISSKHMDKIVALLQDMPRSLLLVVRNNNLLRSVNYALQAPSNRFRIFAHAASRGLHHTVAEDGHHQQQMSWKSLFSGIWFDFQITWFSFVQTLIQKYADLRVKMAMKKRLESEESKEERTVMVA